MLAPRFEKLWQGATVYKREGVKSKMCGGCVG